MRALPVLLVGALAVALAFLVLPVVAIFADVGPGELVRSLGDSGSIDALRVSLEATAVALIVILLVGTPVAWFLATRRFRGRRLVETAIELPLVLPPAVAGVGLLAALGPEGVVPWFGDSLVFHFAGVVVALVFVASPFYVRQAQTAFAALDRSLLEASR